MYILCKEKFTRIRDRTVTRLDLNDSQRNNIEEKRAKTTRAPKSGLEEKEESTIITSSNYKTNN